MKFIGLIGLFCISYMAIKWNVSPEWLLLYISILVAGLAAGGDG